MATTLPRAAGIQTFSSSDNLLGEGPLWSPRERALYWIDIGKRMLHRKLLNGLESRWNLGKRPGCVVISSDGSLALAMGEGVYRFDPLQDTADLISPIALLPGSRFNEGKCDPAGRFWFASMQDNFGPDNAPIPVEHTIGCLFALGPNPSVVLKERNIGISNTLAWSPDNKKLYFADSLINRIFSYDFDVPSGTVTNKRLFLEELNLGVPDGSAMDVDGCLWNARWGAGVVLRITPEGRIDRRIEVPAVQPTSCAFGGDRLDILFITSARIGMAPRELAENPLSGSVFAISSLAQGLPVAAFSYSTDSAPRAT